MIKLCIYKVLCILYHVSSSFRFFGSTYICVCVSAKTCFTCYTFTSSRKCNSDMYNQDYGKFISLFLEKTKNKLYSDTKISIIKLEANIWNDKKAKLKNRHILMKPVTSGMYLSQTQYFDLKKSTANMHICILVVLYVYACILRNLKYIITSAYAYCFMYLEEDKIVHVCHYILVYNGNI